MNPSVPDSELCRDLTKMEKNSVCTGLVSGEKWGSLHPDLYPCESVCIDMSFEIKIGLELTISN